MSYAKGIARASKQISIDYAGRYGLIADPRVLREFLPEASVISIYDAKPISRKADSSSI